ncbi:hypothetical protein C1Y40_04825 [Mycobacterium talmoniae]|nr:hypothetical protein [Mycobacterium eburneum]PQM45017.1 hypothetical protein C1Y40_04825 [Mycobacterium talmoniae]TDH56231.1 hypothetical protein E2F47_08220 [Mycobacterium eburneum]
MANVDYVVLGPGPSLQDVMDAVKAATNATEIVDGNVLVTGDDRTAVTVYSSHGEGVVADVYYGGELDERRAISRRIYDHIVEHTDWDVELDSDDTAGILASRVKSRR